LQRLKELGDKLIVGVSTDEFNLEKKKKAVIPFEQRYEILNGIKHIDIVIPESSWGQKRSDIENFEVDIFGMGDDWAGKFDELNDICSVVYLPRTSDISSTLIRKSKYIINKQIKKNGQFEVTF
jgi:glycerol-3-phosphate cytidylyltransferase